MAKVVETEEWKKTLDHNHLAPVFLRGREFVKFLEAEYQASKAALSDLGFARQVK
jgi:tripartite-type tricarboxylate transporter receptor subunit TctC